MPKTRKEFIKIPLNFILDDDDFFNLTPTEQLVMLKLIAVNKRKRNQTPKKVGRLISLMRLELSPSDMRVILKRLKKIFHNLKSNRWFYYFDDYAKWYDDGKSEKDTVGTEPGTDKEKEKDKDKDKEPSFPFEDIYLKYPKKIGKKAAERHFKASVKTEQDWKNINQALENYLKSRRVYKGFIMNASTFFSNWQDWINFTEPFCEKCKGKGKYTSATGYEIVCDCEDGRQLK